MIHLYEMFTLHKQQHSPKIQHDNMNHVCQHNKTEEVGVKIMTCNVLVKKKQNIIGQR